MKKNSKTLLYILLAVLVICSLCYYAKDTTEHLVFGGFEGDRFWNKMRRHKTHWCDLPGNSKYCTKNRADWNTRHDTMVEPYRWKNNSRGFCNPDRWAIGMNLKKHEGKYSDKPEGHGWHWWRYQEIKDGNKSGWKCILSEKPPLYGDKNLTNPHAAYLEHKNKSDPTWTAPNKSSPRQNTPKPFGRQFGMG